MRTLVATAVSLSLLLGSAAHAQPLPGTITGVVLDAAGSLRAGVTVSIMHVLSEVTVEARTDEKGAFRAADLRPGPYRVSVAADGQGAELEVNLDTGQERRIELRLRPGVKPATAPPASATPNPSVEQTVSAAAKISDFLPTPDRWRLEFPAWQRYPLTQPGEYPYVQSRGLDPYNRKTVKGDRPIIGRDVFLVLTAVSETVAEYRRIPTPSGVSTEQPGSEAFFGRSRQYALSPTGVFSLEMFKGDTAFKPRTWAFRVTPTFSLSYVNAGERNVVNATPEEGQDRRRHDLALQEAFGEVKLFDVGRNYDFVAVRAGIQPFNSDFRGFLFRDTNLGLRVFGTWGRNRNQWNVGVFDQLEKQSNSELNLTSRRGQRVVVANYFRQDFLTKGYTISPSFHANLDDGDDLFFDRNGFLVRPAPIGLVLPHQVRAYYAGVAGDGHIGRLNVSHQFYQAFGHDEFNGVSGRRVDIQAQFGAVEVSIDRDWYRPKAAFVFASGDGDPDDDKGRGFDAILDNPNIAGGPFSFWNREGIRLTQTLVGLVGRSSILPSLRSSKTEGQASFVNPGLLMYSGGLDAEMTRKLRMSVNVNYLRFHKTAPIERLLFQPSLDNGIGLDASVGFQYRPLLIDNVIVTAGASLFKPSEGFRQILTKSVLYTPFAALTLTY